MRILLATPYLSQHYDSGHFWVAALCRLGHSVILWDYRLEREPPKTDYELALVLKGEQVNPSVLRRPRFCYWPDNFARTQGVERLLSGYDRVFTPVFPTPPGYIWLPTGYDSLLHKDLHTWRQFETLYIGTNNSSEKLEKVRFLRPSVVAGNAWENEKTLNRYPPLYLHDFVRMANRATIALDIHQGDVGVNRKLFELVPCAFTLVDRVPGIEEIFGRITPMVSFESIGQAKEMIDYYLYNPIMRESIWQEEQTKIEPFSYEKAVSTVLSYLKLLV